MRKRNASERLRSPRKSSERKTDFCPHIMIEEDFPPLNEGALLYRVLTKVKPAVGHPRYYDFQWAFFSAWLYANSIADAQNRGLAVLRMLPYETVGTEVMLSEFNRNESVLRTPELNHGRLTALDVGLGIELIATPTGTDEGDFESLSLDELML